MPEQPTDSLAEKNAALRRGTRTRIAKRRPDFVDPFSLRKKRKTKTDGDELFSALSPCSEEGNLKVKPQTISDLDSSKKEQKLSGLDEEGSSETVHSLPTSNPKVRLIIRRKPQSHSPNVIKLKTPDEKFSVKLRLRVKCPSENMESRVSRSAQTSGGRQPVDFVQSSGDEIKKYGDGYSPRKVLRKSPHKSPHKEDTKLKLLLSSRPIRERKSLDMEGNAHDHSLQKTSGAVKDLKVKEHNTQLVEKSDNIASERASMKLLVPAEDDSKSLNRKGHETKSITVNLRLKFRPTEGVNTQVASVRNPSGLNYNTNEFTNGDRMTQILNAKPVCTSLELKEKKEITNPLMNSKQDSPSPKLNVMHDRTTPTLDSKQNATNPMWKAKQEMKTHKWKTKQESSTLKLNVNHSLRADFLPIRKRPYMREGRVSFSPMLRRSTRNRRRQGNSR
ncbi:unnamed protein product [Agarophyton chilense]|eukprot:gb/GEZJ01000011.1/.p1 GENE.gb/GEZJ01000011.1/~~gb/GEZJ01000011.1/.p1  ORF type:complete len:447 (+),score=72.26 gb/GEZJ01000011.1/:2249-3589(+)